MNNIVLNKLSLLFFAIVAIALTYLFIGKLFVLFLPFILAWIFSIILQPIVNVSSKYFKLPRYIISIVCVLGLISMSGAIIYALFNIVINLINRFTTASTNIVSELNNYSVIVQDQLNNYSLPIAINTSELFYDSLASIVNSLGNYGGAILSSTLGFVASLPNVIVFIIVTIISTFFMTKDKDIIDEFIHEHTNVHLQDNKYFIFFKEKVLKVLWGYLKAQLILMSITFVLASVGLLILGKDHAFLTALGIAMVDALPIFGPAMIFVPWAITMIIIGKFKYGISLLILYLVLTLTRQLLEPKIVSSQIGVYPLLTLMSIYIGVKTLGISGIFIGPFTVVLLQTIYEQYLSKRNTTHNS
ncbi:MAG: sporulation integral membrane protein YtvI [Acidaminobacteraceae bacterium]